MNEVVKVESTQIISVDKQISLLAKFGLPATSIERHYVRIDWVEDDGKHKFNKSEVDEAHKGMRPIYVLCKRERPVAIYENDDGSKRSVSMAKGYTERMGDMRINTNGLSAGTSVAVVNNILCQSIEPGEVEAFAEM